jgi:sulfopyruvate decarboxylase subunit alpha
LSDATRPAAGADESVPSGAAVIAALKRCGIGIVVSLPDIVTSDGLLWPISRDPELRLVRVCKEDEGVSICAGLAYTGTRSVLLIQHTGLFDSLNALRAIAVEYGAPICMIVGLQGMEPDREPRESARYGVRVVPPVLDAMGIEHARLSRASDVDRIEPAFERAWSRSRPFAFLVGRPPR